MKIKKNLLLATFFAASKTAFSAVEILFEIDLRSEKVKDRGAVGVRGNVAPLSWEKTFKLADADGDGIFSGKIRFENAEKRVEFKFVHDENWESFGGNRVLNPADLAAQKAVAEVWNRRPSIGFFVFEKDGKRLSMIEKMALPQVTHGASVCIFQAGKLDTALVFGLRDVAQKKPVEPSTTFQLGAISQLFVGFALLRAHEMGKIDLDRPINQQLKSWKLPDEKGMPDSKTTLRDLMLGRVAFSKKPKPDGYLPGKKLPTLVQILNGEKPSQERKLKVQKTDFFSFYNALIGQLLLEEAFEKPLEEVLKSLVFEPLGLRETFFTAEMDAKQAATAALGYEKNGSLTVGGYRRHPELGSSGGWSSARDVATFLNVILQAAEGADNRFLSQKMALEAFEPNAGGRSLLLPRGSDGSHYFGGAARGFRTQIELNVSKNWVAVAFLNSWENWRFMLEVQEKTRERILD